MGDHAESFLMRMDESIFGENVAAEIIGVIYR